MIPKGVLDALLVLVGAIWTALSLAIIVDRMRYDRRARRSTLLQTRLRGPFAAAGGAREAARQVTPTEFQALALAGLPPGVEVAMGEELCERSDPRQLRMIADGARRADIRTRITALQILASGRHADAYYALDRCVRSGERDLAAAAVRMLIRLDDRPAAEILIAALIDGAYASSRIAAAIDRMSIPRSGLLAPLLEHPNVTARFWGVRLAGRLLAREWAPRVRQLTAEADPLVRRAAVEALGAIGEPKDRVLVLTRFLDPVPMVRVHAAKAAAAFGGPAVADALAELLGDREWIVRAAARDALRRIGDVGTAALIRTLRDDDMFAANNAAEVLFLTGAVLNMARHLLLHPDDQHTLQTVARFLAVAGPHLERALLDQLGAHDGTGVAALVREGREKAEARHR